MEGEQQTPCPWMFWEMNVCMQEGSEAWTSVPSTLGIRLLFWLQSLEGKRKDKTLCVPCLYGEEEPVLQKPVSSVSGDFRTGPLQRGKSYKVALITSSSICAKLGMVAFDPSCWEAEAGESLRV